MMIRFFSGAGRNNLPMRSTLAGLPRIMFPEHVVGSARRGYHSAKSSNIKGRARNFWLVPTGVTAILLIAAWQSTNQPSDDVRTPSSCDPSTLPDCISDHCLAACQIQRTNTIAELDTLLAKNRAPLVIVRGNPGVGKTQLVQQYIDAHVTEKRHLVRLQVSTLEELRQILNRNYLAPDELLSSIAPNEIGKALARIIQKYPNCLLVFEHVNNVNLLRVLSGELFSSLHQQFPDMQAIMVTCSKQPVGFAVVDVPCFTLAEGLSLIKGLLYKDSKFKHLYDEETAKLLCNRLGYNPLAIRLAITCILESKGVITLRGFMDFAALRKQTALNVKSSPTEKDSKITNRQHFPLLNVILYVLSIVNSVFRTNEDTCNSKIPNEVASCEFAVHEVDRTGHGQPLSELANFLLTVYAFYGSVGIPEDMLESLLQHPQLSQVYPELQHLDRYAVRGFNAQLAQYGVIELIYENNTCLVRCQSGITEFLANICSLSNKLVVELVQHEAHKRFIAALNMKSANPGLQSMLQLLQLAHDVKPTEFINIARTVVAIQPIPTQYQLEWQRYQSLVQRN